MVRRIGSFLLLLFLIPLATFDLSLAQAQQEEDLGRTAEQAGRLREALKHYVAALQSVSEGTASDQKLREKIISLVQRLSPPPAIPEGAERYLARGRAAFKAAKSTSDYEEAVTEFKRASRAAPWLAEAYYNLGVTLDKTGRHDEAIRNLKLYLLAAPNAPDVKEVRSLVFEIEYRQERAQREVREKERERVCQEQARREAEERERRQQEQARREQEERERQERAALDALRQFAGRWREAVDPTLAGTYEVRIRGGACEIWIGLPPGAWVPGGVKPESCSYDMSTKSLVFTDSFGLGRMSARLVSPDVMILEYQRGRAELRRVR